MRVSHRWLAAFSLALTAAMVLPVAGGARQDASPAMDGEIAHPTGGSEVVLQVSEIPGFVTMEYRLTVMPPFTMFGGGRVIVTGPTTLQYPGAALPNLRQIRLNEDGMQAVLRAADAAGLRDGDKQFENSRVTDLSTVVFTTTADGQTSVVSVYGLGTAEENLPADERAARQALAEFVQGLLGQTVWPESAVDEQDAPYAIERIQIISSVVPPEAAATPVDASGPVQEDLHWPLMTSLATAGDPSEQVQGGRCVVLDGEEARQVVAAMQDATTLTRWQSDGSLFDVYPRPLLPNESGCGADPAAGTPAA